MPTELSRLLARKPSSVAEARDFVFASIEDAQVADIARLLVSELATNAVLHGQGEHFEVRVRRGQQLRVEVRDESDALPMLADPPLDQVGGRGLLLVESLSSAWGVEPLAKGKVVWFELVPDRSGLPEPIPIRRYARRARPVVSSEHEYAPVGPQIMQLATLQNLTARLARIVSSREVAAFALSEVLAELGATSGSLCLVEGDVLALTASAGYQDLVSRTYEHFPIDETTPAGLCVLTHQAIYAESLEDFYSRFPVFRDLPITGNPAFATLPLEASDGCMLGVMVVGFETEQQFGSAECELLETVARETAAALERARANEALLDARREAEQARDQLAFLAEASQQLSASLDLEETLSTIAKLAVPRISDRCVLYLLGEGSNLRKFALAPALTELEEELLARRVPSLDDPMGVGAVVRTGNSFFLPRVDETFIARAAQGERHGQLLKAAGIGGTFIVPLRVRGEQIGALAFVNRTGRDFHAGERALAEELATRAAVAIDNARLFGREFRIAETLQHALLPDIEKHDELEVAARYLPGVAGIDVGGDWYDFMRRSPRRSVFVVGDVSGRGLLAATTMALLRFATKAYLAQGDAPATVLDKLDHLLARESDHQFATMLIGEVDIARRQVELASAGHLPPLLLGGDRPEFLSVPVGTPIGVESDHRPRSVAVDLPPNAMLIAFTDGLVERRGEHLDQSLHRLTQRAVLDGDSVEHVIDRVITSMVPSGTDDDIVVFGLRFRGA